MLGIALHRLASTLAYRESFEDSNVKDMELRVVAAVTAARHSGVVAALSFRKRRKV